MKKVDIDKIKVGSIIRFNYNDGDIHHDKYTHKFNGIVKKINLSEKLYKVFSVCFFLNGQVLEAWVIADNVDCVLKESEDAHLRYLPLMEDIILPPQPPPENPWKDVIPKPISKEKEEKC